MPHHGLANAIGNLLVVELGRVHANDYQLLLIGLLQPRDGGEDVVAVDSAEGPELEDDDLALQVGQLQGPRDVEPLATAGELGCLEALLGRERGGGGAHEENRDGPPSGAVE